MKTGRICWNYFLLVAGNEGMEKKLETAIMGYYIGISIRIHSFLPSSPKVRGPCRHIVYVIC